jgi:hypothetical protein
MAEWMTLNEAKHQPLELARYSVFAHFAIKEAPEPFPELPPWKGSGKWNAASILRF